MTMSHKHEAAEPEIVAPETYAQAQQRMAVEQAGKSPQEIMAELPGEYKLDLNNLNTRSTHVWVKRGDRPTILVCEGANHPTHRHTLRK
jgi:hypothetical protein